VASDRQTTRVVPMSGIVICSSRSALRRVSMAVVVVKAGALRRGLWRGSAAAVAKT
jgi:hypothetical protein